MSDLYYSLPSVSRRISGTPGSLPYCVSVITGKTGPSKANLSQHVSVLKAKEVILSRREEVAVYYRISNAKIIEAGTLMREVLLEQIRKKAGWFPS